MRPRTAIIIVDVQNDFISGSLSITNCPAKQNGEEVNKDKSQIKSIHHVLLQVVEPINRLIDSVPFDLHCYSLDWHPSDHVSFVDNVKLRKIHPDSKVHFSLCLVAIAALML